jgi:O-antigen/teichoic acid export membrane protein
MSRPKQGHGAPGPADGPPSSGEESGLSADNCRAPSAVVGHISLSLAASLAIQVLNVAYGVLAARLLGPAGRGELAAVLLWPQVIGSLGSLGVGQAISYFAARQPGGDRPVFGTAMAQVAPQSLCLLVGGYLLMPVVLGSYGEAAVATGRLYLWWIPLNATAGCAAALLVGHLRFGAWNVVRVSLTATTVLGLLGLSLVNAVSVANIVWMHLAGMIVALGLALTFCARKGWVGMRVDGHLLRSMLGFGLKSHPAAVALIINQRVGETMVALLLPPVQVGLYASAAALTQPGGLIGSSVAAVAMPTIAGTIERAEMARTLGQLVRGTVLLAGLVAAGLLLVAPMLIEFFFGEAFRAASDVARLLLVAIIALSTQQVLSSGLRGLGYPLASGVGELATSIVTLIALVLLLPSAGLVGAGVASLLGYAVGLAGMVLFARRALDISVAELLVPRIADLQWMVRSIGHALRKTLKLS